MPGLPTHLQGLLNARAYPHAVGTIELVETHISWVLLTGEFAYKIKRPVCYGFVDLRAIEHRRFLCQEEVRLNGRFAPELYLGVYPVTRDSGSARILGGGPVIEHAVQMRQFARSEELPELLAKRAIAPLALEAFGRELAHMHSNLPVAAAEHPYGQPDAWWRIAFDNVAQYLRLAELLRQDLAVVRRLYGELQGMVDGVKSLQIQRLIAGRVRECHGDMHAANVVRWSGRLVAFDCLEFDPALRWIDVADEIAFLLADLDFLQQPAFAHAFLSAYLEASGDYQACRLLGVFKAHRALVRATVIALRVAQAGTSPAAHVEGLDQCARYVECARHALTPETPFLVLMCGVSGSGKSWMARRLAPRLDAVHLRSDIERRRLMGAGTARPVQAQVGEDRYSPTATERVYERLLSCAADVLGGGRPVIVDATFAHRQHRATFHALAAKLRIECYVVYCRAPEAVLHSRIAERLRRAEDPSEADLAVLEWQQRNFHPPEAEEGGVLLAVSTTEAQIEEHLYRELTRTKSVPREL